jgi:DNA-directed RNA polymerase omega subunit
MKRTEIPPHEELMHKIKNKYEFIMAVSKRARMLVEGAPSSPDIEGVKPTTKALGEILHGKIPWTIRVDPDK